MEIQLQIYKALTAGERAAVLERADHYLSAYRGQPANQRPGLSVWVALTTGLRRSELSRIRMEHFDFARGLLQVWRHKKTGPGYSRGVAWSGAIRDYIYPPHQLLARIEPLSGEWGWRTGPLFCKPLHRYGFAAACHRTLSRDWEAVLHEAGVSVRGIHAARHTFGTLVAMQTGSVFAVRDLLGHSSGSIGISALYVSKNPEILKRNLNAIDWMGKGEKVEEIYPQFQNQEENCYEIQPGSSQRTAIA